MRKCKLLTIIASMMLVLCLGVVADSFASVSYAQSQAKVKVRSANIRQSADADSTVVGSAANGATVTINGQATDSAGTVWYQVFVDADTLGYIRSDLVELIGEQPPATQETPATTETPETTETPAAPSAEVTEVQPMGALVSGSESVRVRSDATTGSQIVAQAKRGLEITVTGYANGTDNRLWYRVKFTADGSEVVGFIRSDYVTLSGELVDKTEEQEPEEPAVDENQPEEPEQSQEPVKTKDWDTEYADEKWILINNTNGERWDINNIFETVKNNQAVLQNLQKESKSHTIIIILLVILVIAMGGVIAALVFKIKDIKDSAYVAEVERETIRRRSADRPAQDRNVMPTVGADKRPAQNGQRPAGTRPAGAPTQGGQRPAGTRPAGAPVQGGQRPAGARPAGAPVQGGQRPAGTRPAGAPAQGGQRPAGTRPAGAPVQGGQRPEGTRPTGAPAQGNRPANAPKPQQNDRGQNHGWKSKNFMTEDDEFEFEFLNWDSDE